MRTRGLGFVAASLLLAAACSDDASDAPSSAGPTTTVVASSTSVVAPTVTTVPTTIAASYEVDVHRDVVYADRPAADWRGQVLDAYVPKRVTSAPIVVLLHGGGDEKSKYQYPEIALRLAQRGALVYNVNWGSDVAPYTRYQQGWTVEQVVEENLLVRDGVACAIEFAAPAGWGVAAFEGGDRRQLVLLGHSAGAVMAAAAAMLPVRPLDGCKAQPRTPDWSPRALVLWDGDWGNTTPDLDAMESGLAAETRSYTPWPQLDRAHVLAAIEQLTTEHSDTFMFRPATTATPWWVDRDPDGVMTADLAAVRAFDDERLDLTDVDRAFAAGLTAHGFENTYLPLVADGTNHVHLAASDLNLLVDEVMRLAGPVT